MNVVSLLPLSFRFVVLDTILRSGWDDDWSSIMIMAPGLWVGIMRIEGDRRLDTIRDETDTMYV